MAGTGSEKKSELTPKQENFIALLLTGVAIAAAAKQVGIGETTAHRWLRNEVFQRAYSDARKSLFDEDLAGLRTGVKEAVAVLKEIAKDREVQASARVRAVQIWLEHAVQLGKLEAVEQRLAEIERRLTGESQMKESVVRQNEHQQRETPSSIIPYRAGGSATSQRR